MGLLNTVGVLQAWVTQHQLQGYSESNIGWIFGAYAFFLYIGGAQVGTYSRMDAAAVFDLMLSYWCQALFSMPTTSECL